MTINKKYDLSFVRFLALFMILFCHIFEWIGLTLEYSRILGIIGNFLAIGVQIFLLLSGYLYGSKRLFEKESRISFIYRNFKKILIDYYLFLLIVIIPVYLFKEPNLVNFNSLFSLLTFSGVLSGVHHLWFIPYILFCYFITPFLYDLKSTIENKKFFIFYFLLLLLLLEIFGIAFEFYFTMAWINCYIIGFFLPVLKKVFAKYKFKLYLGGGLFILSIFIWYQLRYNWQPQLNSTFDYNLITYCINYCKIFQAIFLFSFFVLIAKKIIINKNLKKILDVFDKISYDIFITHMIFVKGTLTILKKNKFLYFNIFVVLFISILSGIILYVISNKIKNWRNKDEAKAS